MRVPTRCDSYAVWLRPWDRQSFCRRPDAHPSVQRESPEGKHSAHEGLGLKIISCTEKGEDSLFETDLSGPICLTGIGRRWRFGRIPQTLRPQLFHSYGWTDFFLERFRRLWNILGRGLPKSLNHYFSEL